MTSRDPKGVPTGGRFAPQQRAEADISLTSPKERRSADLDAWQRHWRAPYEDDIAKMVEVIRDTMPGVATVDFHCEPVPMERGGGYALTPSDPLGEPEAQRQFRSAAKELTERLRSEPEITRRSALNVKSLLGPGQRMRLDVDTAEWTIEG